LLPSGERSVLTSLLMPMLVLYTCSQLRRRLPLTRCLPSCCYAAGISGSNVTGVVSHGERPSMPLLLKLCRDDVVLWWPYFPADRRDSIAPLF
jgi:hypothetical protein